MNAYRKLALVTVYWHNRMRYFFADSNNLLGGDEGAEAVTAHRPPVVVLKPLRDRVHAVNERIANRYTIG
jgi:hypothetical protein